MKIILWILLGIVCLIIALYGMLVLFILFHDIDRERICGNCRYYDNDLQCCWQDGVHRPERCKGCAIFTHYADGNKTE